VPLPASLTDVGGSVAEMKDGRFAVVNHGQVLRYISRHEYEVGATRENLSMTIGGLGLGAGAIVARRLWVSDAAERRSLGIVIGIYALGLGMCAWFAPTFPVQGPAWPFSGLRENVTPVIVIMRAGSFMVAGALLGFVDASRSSWWALLTCV